MNILALITARGGSKRLPGKNIRLLGGRPLIAWSIDIAKQVGKFRDIMVSTDDTATASIARSAGALVPWLRPSGLATDTATSVDVCIHALDWYEAQKGRVDGIVLLQPTSPFRRSETVLSGIELFSEHKDASVVAVALARKHSKLRFQVTSDGRLAPEPQRKDKGGNLQAPRSIYAFTGSFYAVSGDYLRINRAFYGLDTLALIVNDKDEALDIDDANDWLAAESICARHVEAASGTSK